MSGWLLISWLACQSFDVTSTAIALRDPRLHEANGIMRGPQMYPIKVSVNIGALIWQRKLAKRAGKARYVLPVAMAVSGCVAGSLNMRTMRGAR